MNDNSLSRRPIIGGNWKMNTTLVTAEALARNLVEKIGSISEVDVVLCPPFPQLQGVYNAIAGSAFSLGAQNLYWEDAGAFTGEVSGRMLSAVGCGWVIVGHSERRRKFGESSEMVNRKLDAVLRNGMDAIVCIGETREERQAGQTEQILDAQVRESLAGMDAENMGRVVLAYEPVWAIGTGDTATPDQAREAHAYVRGVLHDVFGSHTAERTRIQYGGSVTAANAAELMAEPGIDGALVGGASLKADEFAAIVRAAAGL